MLLRTLSVALGGLAFNALCSYAQTLTQTSVKATRYPERPVRVVAPVAAGGGTDIIARLTVTRLSEVMGQPFVIDNRPGAGGVLGNEIVAHARPDGYTLLFTYAAHTIVPFIYRKAPYDVHKDFVINNRYKSYTYVLSLTARPLRQCASRAGWA